MTTKLKLITSLKIWLVIYPSITLFFYLFGHHLTQLPLYQRTLLLTLVLVPWIVFAGLPLLNFVLSQLIAISAKSNEKNRRSTVSEKF